MTVDLGTLRRYSDLVGIGLVVAVAAGIGIGAATTTGPRATVTIGAGFGVAEPGPSGDARWSMTASPHVTVFVHEPIQASRLEFSAVSFARPRRVVVLLDGRAVATVTVPFRAFTDFSVRLGRLSTGAHDVVLRTSPGPQSISETLGTPDGRRVSIRLLDQLKVQDGP